MARKSTLGDLFALCILMLVLGMCQGPIKKCSSKSKQESNQKLSLWSEPGVRAKLMADCDLWGFNERQKPIILRRCLKGESFPVVTHDAQSTEVALEGGKTAWLKNRCVKPIVIPLRRVATPSPVTPTPEAVPPTTPVPVASREEGRWILWFAVLMGVSVVGGVGFVLGRRRSPRYEGTVQPSSGVTPPELPPECLESPPDAPREQVQPKAEETERPERPRSVSDPVEPASEARLPLTRDLVAPAEAVEACTKAASPVPSESDVRRQTYVPLEPIWRPWSVSLAAKEEDSDVKAQAKHAAEIFEQPEGRTTGFPLRSGEVCYHQCAAGRVDVTSGTSSDDIANTYSLHADTSGEGYFRLKRGPLTACGTLFITDVRVLFLQQKETSISYLHVEELYVRRNDSIVIIRRGDRARLLAFWTQEPYLVTELILMLKDRLERARNDS